PAVRTGRRFPGRRSRCPPGPDRSRSPRPPTASSPDGHLVRGAVGQSLAAVVEYARSRQGGDGMSDVQIVAQPTPNPNSVKFTLDRTVSEGTSKTYQNAEEARESPLASAIFAVQGVTMVFLLNNFITVGKDPAASWHDLVPQIEAAIREHYA